MVETPAAAVNIDNIAKNIPIFIQTMTDKMPEIHSYLIASTGFKPAALVAG